MAQVVNIERLHAAGFNGLDVQIAQGAMAHKVARAQAVSPQVESCNVYLPHPAIASWVESFIDECSSFPNGKYDDQVDQMTQVMNWLRNAVVPPKKPVYRHPRATERRPQLDAVKQAQAQTRQLRLRPPRSAAAVARGRGNLHAVVVALLEIRDDRGTAGAGPVAG